MESMRRFWLPYTCYYITMRGNNRQEIFHSSDDYKEFLRITKNASNKYSFHLNAYCFLNNQYHLLIRSSQAPIPEIMLFINKTYSRYYKQKYKWTGQLYESHFFTSIIKTERELFNISNFMYEQPRLAGLTFQPEAYPYSSFYWQTPTEHNFLTFSFKTSPKRKQKGSKKEKAPQ